jgi:hypothetical protein
MRKFVGSDEKDFWLVGIGKCGFPKIEIRNDFRNENYNGWAGDGRRRVRNNLRMTTALRSVWRAGGGRS